MLLRHSIGRFGRKGRVCRGKERYRKPQPSRCRSIFFFFDSKFLFWHEPRSLAFRQSVCSDAKVWVIASAWELSCKGVKGDETGGGDERSSCITQRMLRRLRAGKSPTHAWLLSPCNSVKISLQPEKGKAFSCPASQVGLTKTWPVFGIAGLRARGRTATSL